MPKCSHRHNQPPDIIALWRFARPPSLDSIPAARTTTSQPVKDVNEQSTPPLLVVQSTLFISTLLISVVGLPWYAMSIGFEWSAWLACVLFCGFTGISITAGYHRLWAHNTYQAHWTLRLFFALFGAAAVENSVLAWASGHRRHHRYVDDDEKDPYCAGRGLWFSHIGWMLRDWPSGEEDFSNVANLKKDRIVVWQHRYYVPITLTMNFAPALLVGYLTGDWLANLLLMGVARLVIVHHATFFINSLAHYWGRRPFDPEATARDNGFLAFFTFGEGYHNFHHRFQTDYRNGIRWYDYDPTKWLISLASWLGLASNLKKNEHFRIHEARVATQLKLTEQRLANTDAPATQTERWSALLDAEYRQFLECLDEWKALRAKIASTSKDMRRGARRHLRSIERDLKAQLRRLSALYMEMAPT